MMFPIALLLPERPRKRTAFRTVSLQSISTVEASRIQADGSYRAWPWTLNDAGKGLFFDSPQQVLEYLDANLTHPDTSIDVGCMQINTKWHGAFFETIDEMLDPASNVAYAASFITDLYHAHGNWDDAIRHYHSNEAKRNGPYLERVLASGTKITHKATGLESRQLSIRCVGTVPPPPMMRLQGRWPRQATASIRKATKYQSHRRWQTATSCRPTEARSA